MESYVNVNMNYQRITLKELSSTLKTRQECKDFCQKSNYYLPDLPKFDLEFILAFASGKKKLLTLNESPEIRLGYSKNIPRLLKKSLFDEAISSYLTKDYIPDNCDHDSLTREYLVTLIWSKNPALFKELQDIYDGYCNFRNQEVHENYAVDISADFIENMKKYSKNSKLRGRRSHIHKIKNSTVLKKTNHFQSNSHYNN